MSAMAPLSFCAILEKNNILKRNDHMIANYHTHTWRCMHATGTEKAYVENAIEGGLKILGFSDHTPQLYPDGYVSSSKMTPQQLEGYVDTVLKLKEEYKNDIEIHVGLETEYYPAIFDKLLDFISDYPIEYMLLGQHNLGNEIGDFFSGAPTDDVSNLTRYVDQCIEAIDTGCFTYVAHPDLIYYTGPDEIYIPEMTRLAQHAKKKDIPLEINFLGLMEDRNYPDARFWKIVEATGNRVIFGSDAHVEHKVWNPETLKKAEAMVKENHLHLIDTVDLVKPVRK